MAFTAIASAQAPSIDIATARSYFDEVKQLSAADAGRLWGRPVAGPMLFVDPESGFIVANRADKDGNFKSQNGVWVGKLPDGMVPANVEGEGWKLTLAPGWTVSESVTKRGQLVVSHQ